MLDRAQQGSARRARKVTAALSSQPAEKVGEPAEPLATAGPWTEVETCGLLER